MTLKRPTQGCAGVLCGICCLDGVATLLFPKFHMLHGGTSYRGRIHGGLSKVFVLERGLREGCPSSPVLFNIHHAAVTVVGQVDEGIEWVTQVDGGLFRPHSSRKRGRCQLRTVLGDVEFADDTMTCSVTAFAPAVERLFDVTLNGWGQKERGQDGATTSRS